MTQLVLTRHGETVWHAENRYAGRSDIALTERGVEQARLLGEWARHAGLTALWCSPLGRARDTAARVADTTGLATQVDERLVELDFGDGEGLTTAEMRHKFPDAFDAFVADPVANHLPGGEDPRDAVARMLACLNEICVAEPDGKVLIVGHTTVLRLVLCQLLGIPLANYRRLFPFMRNAGLTMLRLRDGQTALLEFNTPIELIPGSIRTH
ncbi:histidine phosphatase family protein [Mycobacterium hubeiense]|uniref:histidine phosphatase family protein n=1 Tax=Mycobacterium hubeiense TaxID=1867256 RepID=UPI000C7EE39B|nr:histidine phosphatase family protein [Mycobacterium sp. QGD 101]